ncbi:MAG: helix-turn-helix transcriptional regulator [Clostridia bacterium]|nr:helix-turn-helix transcriptional regulator [Clostridia bacterium]
MPEQWTGDVAGEMHLAKISAEQLAKEIGWHPKYLSAVMNGHRNPQNAEQKVRDALKRLKDKKKE